MKNPYNPKSKLEGTSNKVSNKKVSGSSNSFAQEKSFNSGMNSNNNSMYDPDSSAKLSAKEQLTTDLQKNYDYYLDKSSGNSRFAQKEVLEDIKKQFPNHSETTSGQILLYNKKGEEIYNSDQPLEKKQFFKMIKQNIKTPTIKKRYGLEYTANNIATDFKGGTTSKKQTEYFDSKKARDSALKSYEQSSNFSDVKKSKKVEKLYDFE